MSSLEPFNSLERFAEIERLVSKIYYRFSHLFMTTGLMVIWRDR